MKDLLSVSSTREIMGLSNSTIYKLIASGKISGFRLTDKLLVVKADSLETYLKSCETTPYTPKRRKKD